jgi:RNA polymerase sigma-70 factor, ECF subfamily
MALTDLEIIEDVRSGNSDSFAELVRRYQVKVISLCASLLPPHMLPADAAQDIFVKAYNALDSFRGEASFSTWLYRVAANHCRDLLRKNMREHAESLDSLLEREGDRASRLFQNPPDTLRTTEDKIFIEKMLVSIPAQYREVLILRESQGLNYHEISIVLDCSVDAVKSRLRRARKELLEKARHFHPARNV